MNNTQKKLMVKYLTAFSNLYGMIPIEEAQALLNEYEGNSFSIKIFLGGRDITDPDKYGFVTEDGMIIHNDVIFINDDFYDELSEAQKGKEYVKLPKEEVLKYEDPDYFEHTSQFKNMITFLTYALQTSTSNATEIAESVALMCKVEMEPDMIFSELEKDDVAFANMEQYNQFLQRYIDMANNTRLWTNCGHTPKEIREKMFKK